MDPQELSESFRSYGLDRVAIVDFTSMPESLQADIKAAMSYSFEPLTLVLVGNAGGKFWEHIVDRNIADPVDTFSSDATRRVLNERLSTDEFEVIYPGANLIPLQQLGGHCNWGRSSWLGISINARYGTWFAFRSVAVLASRLASSDHLEDPYPCDACHSRDCLAACPVNAPGPAGQFDLEACVNHRFESISECAAQCLARKACPVGSDYQYPDSAISYFYGRSLETLRHWKQSAKI